MNFCYPSRMSWLTTRVVSKGCPLWMAYNQIKMYPDDENHTWFRAPLDVFYYTVMPFGLKNACATYQHAMNTIFRDHLWKTMECNVDDIAIKIRDKNSHLHDLRTMFDLMRVRQIKMNPTKSFFGSFTRQVYGIHCHIQRNSSWSKQDQSYSGHAASKGSKRTLRYSRQVGLHPKIYCKPVGS